MRQERTKECEQEKVHVLNYDSYFGLDILISVRDSFLASGIRLDGYDSCVQVFGSLEILGAATIQTFRLTFIRLTATV